nr:helicase-associated domain-containing protein [Moorella glycerini]
MDSYQDILGAMPLDFLQRLSQNLNLKVKMEKPSIAQYKEKLREKLYTELLSFYSSPANIIKLWQKAGPPGQLMLETILFNNNLGGLINRVHERINQVLGKGTAREVGNKLLNHGLLFIRDGGYGQKYYYLPAEIRAFIYYTKAFSLLEQEERTAPASIEDQGQFLLVDFYILLAAVLRGDIKIAQAGHIYKRDRKKILLLQHYPEAEERSELLEQLAIKIGFIEEEDGRAVLSAGAWDWLQMSRFEQWACFVDWLVGSDVKDNWQVWPAHILTLLLAAPPDRWLSLPALYQLIPMYYSKTDCDYIFQKIKALLQKYLWIGLIARKGDQETGAIRMTEVFRCYFSAVENWEKGIETDEEEQEAVEYYKALMAPYFPEESSFVVQPNFEIIAPLEIAPALLLQLSSFADLASADRMFIFNLNEKSFYRGFRSGQQPEAMIQIVKEHSKYELPANVLASLEEWAARMGKVSLVRGVLVRCQRPEQALQVKALLEKKEWLIEAITPRDFLIPEDIAPDFLDVLEKEGYMPYPDIIVYETLDEDGYENDYEDEYDLQDLLNRAVKAIIKDKC